MMRYSVLTNRIVVFFLMFTTSVAMAASNSIDGIWIGEYSSGSSTDLTKEIIIFKTVSSEEGSKVVGAYLTADGFAGTLEGAYQDESNLVFILRQPMFHCPQAATGVLKVELKDEKIEYFYFGKSCTGEGTSQGTGSKISTIPQNKGLLGFWQGSDSTTFFFDFIEKTDPIPAQQLMGIYVNDNGNSGILTGTSLPSIEQKFTLTNTKPSPTCSAKGVLTGEFRKDTTALSYSFVSTDCSGKSSTETGQATSLSTK
ncbi:hypothetical protein [Candidatus Albibeggiatoa sp. nov. NOAA]|uniref:hypothetical protein n=1 Tax=Candidatus Albibeggiatoa sp. nov. NOAA TaxID=3162724 RepID=UPI00330128DD|nr:hypothetical protein [Thiotrichaceae bacterium]